MVVCLLAFSKLLVKFLFILCLLELFDDYFMYFGSREMKFERS